MSEYTQAVLFDLDGTLADTGADLVEALNVMRRDRGLDDIPVEVALPLVGHGSRVLMREYLIDEGEEIEPLRPRFLKEYDNTKHANSTLFDGIEETLKTLEQKNVPWAIVTNKPTLQTMELLPYINLDGRAAHIVCSDTLKRYKPNPDGLLFVCEKLALQPEQCFYVGDADIDIAASSACSMPFIAAGWGYWPKDQQSKHLLQDPRGILDLLD